MRTRRIGRTGLEVTELCFGCAPIGGLYEKMSEAGAAQTLQAAYAAGIRYFDMAPFYGAGLAEHRFGSALREVRDDVVLSTKVGRLLRSPGRGPAQPNMFRHSLPFDVVHDYGYDGVMRSIEDSLQRIGVSAIDIVFIHDVNRHWHGDAVEARFRECMEGGYRALEQLRRSGDIKAFGVGMNDAEGLVRFARAGDFDVFMLAGRYTLLDQSPLDTLLPECTQRGISVVAAAPFNSGILAGGATQDAKYFYREAPAEIIDRTRRIEAVCRAHDVPLPAAAIRFALGHPAVVSVAAGMAGPDEVADDVAAMSRPIPSSFWSDLKTEGLLRPDTPLPG